MAYFSGGGCAPPVTLCSFDIEMINNTIARNSGYGVRAGAVNSAIALNNIVAGNGAYGIYDSLADFDILSFDDFFQNSPADWVNGTNATPDNTFVDPMFADAANGDYHLAAGSPCIDTGNTLYVAPDHDRDGVSRPLDGDGDGLAAADRGAYEHAGTGFDLRRADFTSLGPSVPDMSQVFPFEAANSFTPVVVAYFADGDLDSPPSSLVMSFYQVSPDPQHVLLAVKLAGGIRFNLR